jgi:hypothetical protein
MIMLGGLRQGVADYVMVWWQDRRARRAAVPVVPGELAKQEPV